MNKRAEQKNSKFAERRFNWSIFVITFLVFGAMLTVQMFILRDYVQYKDILPQHFFGIIFYWLVAALGFTLLTLGQINRRYKLPLQQFAKATRRVANGDFSVYVPPKFAPHKQDFLDKIFIDFNKMVEELGSIETLKTDFFSNVSHEIKTPLASIQGYGEMLQKTGIGEQTRKEYAANIVQSAKKLAALISNILKLNRLEKQAIYEEPQGYNLCAQLCECALQFEDAWSAKSIEFEAELEDEAFIAADEDLMSLVWNNLVSNAVKFTEKGGKISLKQYCTGSQVVVCVADNGCGMGEETQRHIFDKFYQGDSSHACEGNGLGLALALRVIDLSGGEILVQSTKGSGSTFTVKMPKAKQEEEE